MIILNYIYTYIKEDVLSGRADKSSITNISWDLTPDTLRTTPDPAEPSAGAVVLFAVPTIKRHS